LGWVLADSIIRRTRSLGASAVDLIAGETAEFFIDKLGFHPVDIEDLPMSIRSLSNFARAWREGALCMTFDLSAETSPLAKP